MKERQRQKQWRAAREAMKPDERAATVDADLLDRAVKAAAGNPGLQSVLTRPVLSGQTAAAETAIAAIEQWRTTGAHPKEASAAQDFFARMSFETYANALTAAQTEALRAATLFDDGIAVPVPALHAAMAALDVQDSAGALRRLLALGLMDDLGRIGWAGKEKHPHAAANPLARPLAAPLTRAR